MLPIPINELENHYQLYLGDCINVLGQLEPESVDMIFADPPYKLSNDGFTCKSGKRASVNKGDWDRSDGIESDFEFHKAWIKACGRVLKKDGSIWISGTYHSIYACGFALQISGWRILNDIAWFKPNASPNLSCRYFTASHESLIWAAKDKSAKHYFDYPFAKNALFANDFIKAPGKQMRSVWAIGTPRKSEKVHGKHPTQKPLDLTDRIVQAACPLGGVVLDPFMGTAAVGVSALAFGRRFIGIELDPQWLPIAIKRLEEGRQRRNQAPITVEIAEPTEETA